MKNYIAIDPSEKSTAITIKSNKGYFLFIYTTLNPDYKWIKLTKNYISFRFYQYSSSEDYSENEIFKLQTFAQISQDIIQDILEHIDLNEESIIGIEGYNYNLFSGASIIDLVGVSTAIRLLILLNIPKIEKFLIIAPKSLKSSICELVYGLPEPRIGKKGKPLKEKLVAISPYGIKGGDFTKRDMFLALLDGKINSPLDSFNESYQEEILSLKDIKKPMEDIVDSILLLQILQTRYP